MKTKKLIELLQKSDPLGESHVRFDGDPIIGVSRKPGYWDGPYNYIEINEEGKRIWVESTRGNKVDIQTMDMFDFAERHNGIWEEVKNAIRVEYDYLDDEKEKEFMAAAKAECDEYNRMLEDIKNR